MQPPAEMVHWLFGVGFGLLGLCLLAEALVGSEVWGRRPWRRYLWPSLLFTLGVLMWPVMAFFTNSAVHMYAHGSWAEFMMLAGGAELGLATGRLRSPWWRLALPAGFVVGGAALILHEQNAWLFARSAFLHHLLGWTMIGAAVFPLGKVFRPRSVTFHTGIALSLVVVAVMLLCDRDVAPVFGHLSQLAGAPHR